jgi:hypothetical protein
MVHGGTKRHPEALHALAIQRFRSCQNVAQLERDRHSTTDFVLLGKRERES